jgi:hypothetical protein
MTRLTRRTAFIVIPRLTRDNEKRKRPRIKPRVTEEKDREKGEKGETGTRIRKRAGLKRLLQHEGV